MCGVTQADSGAAVSLPAEAGALWLSQDSRRTGSQPAVGRLGRGMSMGMGLFGGGRNPEASFVSGRPSIGVDDGATFIKQVHSPIAR